ncbi:FtsX-like permease family protein [Enteractinococcus fodinae]|uniref:ABC transport system permease protein n=1 Tax=Enteractinococcus fodinae TaxID=684663 RepID=A0ABU2AWY4_9MICC|nr:FtsX-like permease family protein [Enteractinococcus fodinae]MDR7345863.1 putative ABC transport system permease protein [Enteractinococcus fodinae]
MWKVAISQLTTHPRRYVAVVVAIVLGTLFLAAALLVTSSAKETTKHMLGATYANADLLIVAELGAYFDSDSAFYDLVGTADAPGSLERIPGVTEVYPLTNTPATMVLPEDSTQRGTFGPNADFVHLTSRPADASLLSAPFVDGALPEAHDEVTIDAATADRHEVSVADTLTIRSLTDDTETDFTVSGIFDNSMNPTVVGAVTGYVTPETLTQLADGSQSADMALLRVDGDLDQVLAEVQQAIDSAGLPLTVNTPDVQISEQLVDMMGFDAITVVLGGFSAIALLVMTLVIHNTFSVLVAQRTRQYALQRVLGATRGQIRKSVLTEAVLIGLIGSVVGIALAIGLMVALLRLAQTWIPGATFGMDASIVWVVVIGVVMTVAASWLPAAQATRVSPVAAMRPVPEVTAKSSTGAVRLVLGAVLILAGGAALVHFSLRGMVGPAIFAGALSFLGVLALGVLFVPGAVYALGWLPRLTGTPGKMAQLNAVRNRSRTAATAAALIIGTTLVTLILTGGRTVQHNTDELLATNYPVDIYVELSGVAATDEQDVSATTERLAATSGISSAEALAPVASIDEPWAASGTIFAGDPNELATISDGIADDEARALQTPGTVLVPATHTADTVTIRTADEQAVTLEAIRSELDSVTPVVSPQTAEAYDLQAAGAPVVWLAVDSRDMTQSELQELVTTMIAEAGVSAQDVNSPLMQRAVYQQAINAVMLTVIGLLSISVVIAFVGVANTLSLSTLERTRENSLMRALGLTRGGLRSMLIWEAILISAIGAILGSALGMLYGWAGSVAIFAEISPDGVEMSWPWLETAVVVLIAVSAGLLASLAPSRRAAKLSPVQGLATV